MEWAKFQERERKKEEEEKEKERVAYAQIDWHDFVVVETVDFQPNEQGRSVTPDGEPELRAIPGQLMQLFPESSRLPQGGFTSVCFISAPRRLHFYHIAPAKPNSTNTVSASG